jgi:hypothetical protein
VPQVRGCSSRSGDGFSDGICGCDIELGSFRRDGSGFARVLRLRDSATHGDGRTLAIKSLRSDVYAQSLGSFWRQGGRGRDHIPSSWRMRRALVGPGVSGSFAWARVGARIVRSTGMAPGSGTYRLSMNGRPPRRAPGARGRSPPVAIGGENRREIRRVSADGWSRRPRPLTAPHRHRRASRPRPGNMIGSVPGEAPGADRAGRRGRE